MNRIVFLDGKLVLDIKHNIQARGTYICKDTTCHDKMKKQKVFNRAYKRNFQDSEVDELFLQLKEVNND